MSFKSKPVLNMAESDDSPTKMKILDLIDLGNHCIPLRKILFYLSVMEKINLASTNTQLRSLCIKESEALQRIENSGNLDISEFSCLISKSYIQAIVRTFPDLNSITAHLGNVDDHLLDELQKLEKLSEITLLVGEGHTNYNKHGLEISKVNIKAEYFQSTNDSTYSILWQIRSFRHLSILSGQISHRTILLMQTRNLIGLEIHNSIIHSANLLTNYILTNQYLKKLRLSTNNHTFAPHPCIVMNNILSLLPAYHEKMYIKDLIFTLDQDCRVCYSNLKYLKFLKNLTIFYTVQGNGINLEKVIHVCAELEHVTIKFVEFIEKYRILSKENLENIERKSYFYKNIIESMNNIAIEPIDYIKYKQDNVFTFEN